MTKCGAVNHSTKTRCSRSKTHITNGMPHKDNAGNTWPLIEREQPLAHRTPNVELKTLVRKAMRRYIDRRTWQRIDDEALHALYMQTLELTHEMALDFVNEFRRLNGQKEVETQSSYRKMLKFKEKS